MSFRFLRIQPFKGLYLIYQVLTTLFIRVPLWILFALPRQETASLLVFFLLPTCVITRSRRPRPSWDLKRVLGVNLVRQLLHTTAR